jgi:hypothetical protein
LAQPLSLLILTIKNKFLQRKVPSKIAENVKNSYKSKQQKLPSLLKLPSFLQIEKLFSFSKVIKLLGNKKKVSKQEKSQNKKKSLSISSTDFGKFLPQKQLSKFQLGQQEN